MITDSEEFRVSLIAYINYIQRKIKRDSEYQPHPLVKAIYCALQGMEDHKDGAVLVGVSGDAQEHADDRPKEMYFVSIRKDDEKSFTLLKVRDATIGRDMPIEHAMQLLLLSMKLDKYEGKDVPVDVSVDIMNEVVPTLEVIRFNNSEWKEARDSFKEIVKQGNLRIQNTPENQFVKDLLSVRTDTPWEEYPPSVRATIAQAWIAKTSPPIQGKNPIVISSIEDKVEKHKVIRFVREFLYGKPSDYFCRNVSESEPSLAEQEPRGYNGAPVGRSHSCPCGSGKKYKKCCGR